MVVYEIERDEYIKEYKELCDRYNVDAGSVWDNYHSRVEFALGIIPNYRIGDEKATQKQLRVAFGISANEWKVMKKTFKRFEEALESDKANMELVSEIALLKGVNDTGHQNAKMIEMMLKVWNSKYAKKEENQVELPSTLEVVIKDASEK